MTSPAPSATWRTGILAVGALIAVAACSNAAPPPPTQSPSTSPSTSTSPNVTPTPTPSPTITVDPAPVVPGTSRGRVLFVQQAEDASLVSGGRPIRLTLTRTGNIVSWFSAPAQRRSGTMSTEQMMLTLGWRPARDGSTAILPQPRPQALLAFVGGTLTFTILRANVRADGTLVMDISPIGRAPATVDSYGPVTLTIDGAPGVRVQRSEITAGITAVVTITGRDAQQVLVQIIDESGRIVDSRFLAPDRPETGVGTITAESGARIEQGELLLQPPTKTTDGFVRLTGTIDLAGTPVPLEATLAQWTWPES